jgi:hypothetical protein
LWWIVSGRRKMQRIVAMAARPVWNQKMFLLESGVSDVDVVMEKNSLTRNHM